MRHLLFFTFVFVAMTPCLAQHTSESADEGLLGLDRKQIRPPDPAKGKPLARVFNQYVYLADLKAKSTKLTEEQSDLLSGRILVPLLERYAAQKKIAATPKEIEDYNKAIHKIVADSGAPLFSELLNKKENAQIEREVGEKFVKQWKLSKALYEEYGGTVIFQQGNPLEPVGAYRKFLEKMERGKVFEIFDESNRKTFWHYFTREHPFKVPPSDIDYSVPWWMKKPKAQD